MSKKPRVTVVGDGVIFMALATALADALEVISNDSPYKDTPKKSNQWRGGSRGKGGKTKWPKR